MRIGTLRHRVEIQRSTSTQNGYGEPVVTWATIALRWAEVLPAKGTETLINGQFRAEVPVRLRMRWVDGVTPRDRVLFDRARTFDINSVVNTQEHKRELVIDCTERV